MYHYVACIYSAYVYYLCTYVRTTLFHCILDQLMYLSVLNSFLILAGHTVFTWLKAAPRIVTALDWYHNRFQNYGYKHRLRASSNDRF